MAAPPFLPAGRRREPGGSARAALPLAETKPPRQSPAVRAGGLAGRGLTAPQQPQAGPAAPPLHPSPCSPPRPAACLVLQQQQAQLVLDRQPNHRLPSFPRAQRQRRNTPQQGFEEDAMWGRRREMR